mgnify:CR=1 FL=1
MNNFMNGMMSGLGFMNGVGMYNSFFQMGYQKQMAKQQKQSISDRITDAFNRNDMLTVFGGPKGLGHALYKDMLNNYSEDFLKSTITEIVGKDNTDLFWGEEEKAEAWRVY